MIRDLVYNSLKADGRIELEMSEPVYAAMVELRHFLYDQVYRAPQIHREYVKAKKILNELFLFFGEHFENLAMELEKMGLADLYELDPKRKLCDFLASLTDNHAIELFQQIYFPKPLFAKPVRGL